MEDLYLSLTPYDQTPLFSYPLWIPLTALRWQVMTHYVDMHKVSTDQGWWIIETAPKMLVDLVKTTGMSASSDIYVCIEIVDAHTHLSVAYMSQDTLACISNLHKHLSPLGTGRITSCCRYSWGWQSHGDKDGL